MRLTFHGAAGSVTGSCFLLTLFHHRVLIDCGLHQGGDGELNYQPFPLQPGQVDLLVLTHAHIDHSGRIPLLTREGFHGRILATRATASLCEVMLRDSAHIQEMEADWISRKHQRAGLPPVKPLYTVQDAEQSLPLFEKLRYYDKIELSRELALRFLDAGHILGSALVELSVRDSRGETRLVFSGDVGKENQAIIRDPDPVEEADFLVLECTYGDRLHRQVEVREEQLAGIIRDTFRRGGNLIIPSFAVGRTQELIYTLDRLVESGSLPPLPVYIDSPLAIAATEVFRQSHECYDDEARRRLAEGDPFRFAGLRYVQSVEESRALNQIRSGAVIIAASGMCEAGRIKHHLKHNLWRPECSLLLVGYQAEGTLGRQILDGADKVKIFGEDIAVRARVYSLDGFSAHADQRGLLEWLGRFRRLPRRVFLVHGEPPAAQALAGLIEKRFGIEVYIPHRGETVQLNL